MKNKEFEYIEEIEGTWKFKNRPTLNVFQNYYFFSNNDCGEYENKDAWAKLYQLPVEAVDEMIIVCEKDLAIEYETWKTTYEDQLKSEDTVELP